MAPRRLLLIAMSGVRVKDKELLEFGMTLPGFVERSKVIASLPSLSLLTVASHTPPHWDINYREIDEFDPDETVQEIVAGDYDLIGISAFTARILDAYALADRLRLAGQTVALGGLHVSVMPDEAQLHADAICIGQGENIWPSLIRDFETGTLAPVYRSDAKSQFSLADSRVPRYDLLDFDRYNRITMQTTRGCPLACDFCAASRLISPYQRKPIDLVRRDLEAILAIWPRPFIELAEDNTFVHKPSGRAVAKLFGEYDIKWFTETDISVADDPELLELLAESGCAQLLIGLESPSSASLAQVDKKQWKLRQREHYLDKITRIQSYGISVNGCFILGFDQDTPESFAETKEFVMESKLAEVQITVLTPFPGTELYARLSREQGLLKTVFWDECTLFDVTYQPAQMSLSDLQQGFRWLMRELYTDQAVADRKAHFRKCVRTARESRTLTSQRSS